MWASCEGNLERLVGRKLDAVSLSREKDVFGFAAEGIEVWLGVEGDCCSYSWVEHVTVTPGAIGAEIIGYSQPNVEQPSDTSQIKRPDGYPVDSLAVYELRLHTRAGDVVVEFRNDSNGYYGGYIVTAAKPDAGVIQGVR